MRGIVWTPEARANLAGIRTYIAQVSPLAAQRLALRIVAAVESLADNAERGRPVRADVRELTAIWPYLIRYRVEEDTVVVLRVRHGARRPG